MDWGRMLMPVNIGQQWDIEEQHKELLPLRWPLRRAAAEGAADGDFQGSLVP